MITASTTKSTFSRQTTVETDIQAPASTIWQLLTDSSNYPNWNSTIVSLEGAISLGNTLKLVSTLDPKRTFKLKVRAFEPNKLLIWGDPMGKRTFMLSEQNGTTCFVMTEKIGGPLFPLFANKIPSFDKSFEAFAQDLKTEAER